MYQSSLQVHKAALSRLTQAEVNQKQHSVFPVGQTMTILGYVPWVVKHSVLSLNMTSLFAKVFPNNVRPNISTLFPRRLVRLGGCGQDPARLPWVSED